MELKIEKPLVILKVHTTGLDTTKDRIVAITIRKHDKDGGFKSGTRMINPECQISELAVAKHGITNEAVQNEKTFSQVGKNLFDFIGDADVAGFNIRFDLEILTEEFSRIGLDYKVYNRHVIDLHDAYMKSDPHSFASAIKKYVDPSFKDGIISTDRYTVLCEDLMGNMLRPNGENFFETLNTLGVNTRMLDVRGFFGLDGNKAVFNFGKYKGRLVSEVLQSDEGYYDWMKSDKSGLPKETLALAALIIKKAKSAKN